MNDERMSAAIRRTGLALVVMLLAMAIITGYWQVARGALLSQREDNPRRVLAEQQIPRGAIQDRHGYLLAVSQNTPAGYRRHYPEPSAAPVVGYSSLRYGVGGIEATFDKDLRGTVGLTGLDTFRNELLHRVPVGRSVQLTLDASLQRAADAALGDRTGAILVLTLPEGEVLALVSHPTFDPARLDQDWEHLRADPAAPLFNRATLGSYQPGAAFQMVLLAQALSKGIVRMTDTLAVGPVPTATINDQSLGCATPPISNTVEAAFAAACPAELAAWVDRLAPQDVFDAIHGWKLDTAPEPFELPTAAADFDSRTITTAQSLFELVLGQGALTVSPLQMATVLGTIANGGRMIASPHLTPQPDSLATLATAPAIIPAPVANALQAAFPVRDGLAGQTALALGGDKRLVWFLGFAPSRSPTRTIVILLENGDVEAVHQIAATLNPLLP